MELTHKDMKEGDHAWASVEGKLVIVCRTAEDYVVNDYEVCGPWECGIGEQDVTLIERIHKPEGYEHTTLYYK